MASNNLLEYEVIEEIVSLEEAMDVDPTLYDTDLGTEEEKLLQQKFVQGEIGFAEYSSQLGALYTKAEDPLECEQEEEEEVLVTLQHVEEWEEVEARENKRAENVKKVKEEEKVEEKPVVEKKAKVLRPRVKLEGALKGMLGEATVMFVKKENQQRAINMVLEVVRQCPNSPEAYKTLASMYEDIGDTDTSIKMLHIGAHLSSDNAEEWVQLGRHFEKTGDKRQAITCYSKALKADVSLVEIHDKRLRLCDEIDLKNRGFVLTGYQRFLKSLGPDSNPHTVLELSLRAAHWYHGLRQIPQAAAALHVALQHCGPLVRPDHVNLYLELLLEMRRYEACVSTLCKFTDVRVDFVRLLQIPQADESEEQGGPTQPSIQVTDFSLPSPLPPPELLAKLGLTLVHLRSEPLFHRLLTALAFDLDTYGDLYLDIAEALVQEKYHEHALQVLKKLVASTKYNQPGVWKQLAETYEKLGFMEECKAAYRRVLEQVPLYLDIRRHLSDIYMREGRVDEAVDVLRQFAVHADDGDEDLPSQETAGRESHSPSAIKKERKTPREKTRTPKSRSRPAAVKTESTPPITSWKEELFSSGQLTDANDRISAPLLLDQLVLMTKTGQSYVRQDEFFSLLRLLLSQNCIRVKNSQEAKVVLTRSRVQKKIDTVATMRGVSKHSVLDNRASFTAEPPVNQQDILGLYKHAMEIATKNNDFTPMLDIIVQIFGSPLFQGDSIPGVDQFTLEAALVLYSTGHIDRCYNLFRPIMLKYLDSKAVFNLVNLIMIRVEDSHIFRNTMRTFKTNPDNFALNVLYANNCILTGNYKYCINEFSIISKNQDHRNPLYLLLLACSYTNIACTKFMEKKALLVSHALAWMSQYKERRGAELSQEVMYNTGRMYHQLGLLSQAVCFYKRALVAKPCLPQYDLRCEIAYNLHLIYLHSRSYNLARHVLDRYLIV